MGWTSYINEEILEDFKRFQEVFLTPEKRAERGCGDLIMRGPSKRIFHDERNLYYLSELFALGSTELASALNIPTDRWNRFIVESVMIEKPEY